MPEVNRQYIFRELFHLPDDEALSVLGPADRICVLVVLLQVSSTSRISYVLSKKEGMVSGACSFPGLVLSSCITFTIVLINLI